MRSRTFLRKLRQLMAAGMQGSYLLVVPQLVSCPCSSEKKNPTNNPKLNLVGHTELDMKVGRGFFYYKWFVGRGRRKITVRGIYQSISYARMKLGRNSRLKIKARRKKSSGWDRSWGRVEKEIIATVINSKASLVFSYNQCG